MKSTSFTAMAIGLATTLTTPVCWGQAAQSSSSEHSHAADQSSASSSDVSGLKEIRASKLIGVNVSSKDGENLGQVQDLVINPRTGKIRFALVGQGLMAGLSQTLIPVPWQAVKVQSEHQFALNVDKSKMKNVPNWTQSEMEQPDYIVRIYRFYELEPQSDQSDQSAIGGPGSSSSESGQGQGSSKDSSPSSEQSKDLPKE